MSLNSHSLIEIPQIKWNILLELYAERRTEPTGYNVILNYIQWIQKEPDLDVKFYSLDGDWQTDGTFIIIADNGTRNKHVFFNTLSNDLDRLAKGLLCLSSPPEEYLFFGYADRLLPAVKVYQMQFPSATVYSSKTIWYKVSKEIVDKYSITPPPGITLRKLEFEDAQTVNDLWPLKSADSINFVKLLINHKLAVGACDKDGKLIAWCLRSPLGALAMLQVEESHKRLGIGSLLVRYMSRKIAELNEEVLTTVVIENTLSRRMFEKLGFEDIDKANWSWY